MVPFVVIKTYQLQTGDGIALGIKTYQVQTSDGITFHAICLTKTKQTLIRKPRNLEFDDQGINNPPTRVCGKLDCSNTDMGPLVLAKMGEY
jgi:hypothetical protein